jgi:hypothetical protein
MSNSHTHHGKVSQWPEYSGFKPLQISPCEIRLLYLDQIDTKGALRYALRHAELHASTEFCALSYSWGAPVPERSLREIFIHGQPVKIRPTLRAFLQTMAHDRPQMAVWADALCINQHDSEERNRQVSIMPHIFKLAREVYVWLGQGDDDTNYALDHLADAKPQTPFDPEMFSICAAKLLKVPYWNRRWVIQEFALAQEIVVVCGAFSTPWHHFETKISDEVLKDDQPALTTFNEFKKVRLLNSQPQTSFLDLMERFRDSRCVDPRDKVFSLRGISKDGEQVRPRYNESYTELFFRLLSILPTERVLPAISGYRWPHKSASRLQMLMEIEKEDLLQSLRGSPDDQLYTAFEQLGVISEVRETISQTNSDLPDQFASFPSRVRVHNIAHTFQGVGSLKAGDLVYSIQTTQRSPPYFHIAFRPGNSNGGVIGTLILGPNSEIQWRAGNRKWWETVDFNEQSLQSICNIISHGVLRCSRNIRRNRILCHINRRTLVLLWVLEAGKATHLLDIPPEDSNAVFWVESQCKCATRDKGPAGVNISSQEDIAGLEILPSYRFSGDQLFWTKHATLPWTVASQDSVQSAYPRVHYEFTHYTGLLEHFTVFNFYDNSRTGLSYAVDGGLVRFVNYFNSGSGFEITPVANERLALRHAAASGHEGLALWRAAASGHDDIVQTLLENGVSASIETRTGKALAAACSGGHENIVRQLLQEHAKVYWTGTGNQALYSACQGGNDRSYDCF